MNCRCTVCGCVLDDNQLVNNMEFTGNGEGSAYFVIFKFLIDRLVGQIVSENGSSAFTSASGRYSYLFLLSMIVGIKNLVK